MLIYDQGSNFYKNLQYYVQVDLPLCCKEQFLYDILINFAHHVGFWLFATIARSNIVCCFG